MGDCAFGFLDLNKGAGVLLAEMRQNIFDKSALAGAFSIALVNLGERLVHSPHDAAVAATEVPHQRFARYRFHVLGIAAVTFRTVAWLRMFRGVHCEKRSRCTASVMTLTRGNALTIVTDERWNPTRSPTPTRSVAECA